MSKTISRTQAWHLPFISLIALFTALVSLSHYMADFAKVNVIASGFDLESFRWHGIMITATCLSIYLLAVRNVAFDKVFFWTLKGTFALVVLAYLFLFQSPWGFILFKNVFPNLFLLLGWSYLNNMYALSGARKSYFAIVFFSSLFAIPLIYLPMILGFGNKLMTDGIFGVMLLGYVLILVNLRWIKSKFASMQNINFKNLSLMSYGLSLLAIGFLFLAMRWSAATLLSSLKEQAKSLSVDGEAYILFMQKGHLKIEVISLIIYALAFFKGAYLVKKMGWLKTMFITPVIAAIVFIVSGFVTNLDLMTIGYALISGCQGAFVFPLLMISFLAFSTKDRFCALGFVVLVITPILDYALSGQKFYFASAFAISFGLIIIYLLSSFYLSKKVMTQTVEESMRK